MNNKPNLEKPLCRTKTKMETEHQKKKTRSPLSDLNRGTNTTSCFRFLKSNSSSTSTSNSNSDRPRLRKPIPSSAPPKNPSKGLKPNRNEAKSKPAKTHQCFVGLTPVKEKSGNTPPIETTISPEIPCGSLLAPTPVCFAAGHMITGVTDKRKCKPRNIHTIGNEINFDDGFDKSGVSTSSPSLRPLGTSASVKWLSSPSDITSGNSDPKTCSTKCQAEPPFGWLLSPHQNSSDHKSRHFSTFKSESPAEKSSSFRSNSSPFVRRTPSSNSSTSPFSVILKRASKSSIFNEETFERETMSFTEIFESMDLSKTSKNGVSFEFGHNFRPLNSVDLSRFRNPNSITPESDKRISWREGLVSRIFEMGQTGQVDCCKWLSDCDDDDLAEIEKDLFEVNAKISRDRNAKCEFAESICLKGEDESVSSDDSDWKLLYQNKLFDL